MKARVVVNKIREKYVKWGEDEEDEVLPLLFCSYFIRRMNGVVVVSLETMLSQFCIGF